MHITAVGHRFGLNTNSGMCCTRFPKEERVGWWDLLHTQAGADPSAPTLLLCCPSCWAARWWVPAQPELFAARRWTMPTCPFFGWGWSRRPSLCACRGQTAGAWLGAAAWQLRALPQLLRQCWAVVAPRALDSSCFSSQGLNTLILGYSASRGTTEIACPCSKWIILGNCPAWIAYGFKTWWS